MYDLKTDPTEQKAAFDALQALGERRTRAMVALVQAIDSKGIGSGGMRKALEAAHFDGQEQLLIDLLKDGTTPRATKEDVLRNIEPFDSPEVREYLLQRLAAETDRYFYATLILALGRLKEARVAPEVRRLLARDSNWTPFHVYGIIVLGKVGGPEAEAILLEHLRSGTLGNLGSGVNALAPREGAGDVAAARALTVASTRSTVACCLDLARSRQSTACDLASSVHRVARARADRQSGTPRREAARRPG